MRSRFGCRSSILILWKLCGGQGRNRTADTRIFSPLLYQLSYLATLGSLTLPKRTTDLKQPSQNCQRCPRPWFWFML